MLMRMRISSGDLRERITLQQKIVERDAYGAESITWQDMATVWARVEAMRGQEAAEGKQWDVLASYRVVIRHREDVDETMRIVWRNRILDIVALAPDGKRQYLTVFAESHVM